MGARYLCADVGGTQIKAAVLEETVRRLQAVVDLPLQIDTSDPVAMERARAATTARP